MPSDEVNLGALKYQDLSNPNIENLTTMKTVDVPIIDGYDPFDSKQFQPSGDSSLTDQQLQDSKTFQFDPELFKGTLLDSLIKLVKTPGDVYNSKTPMTVEDLIPKAVDMATSIIGNQMSKGVRPTGYYQGLPKLPKGVLNASEGVI